MNIQTPLIQLKERTERRQHIEEQFQGKVEFALHWIEAIEHSIGAVGLWQAFGTPATKKERQARADQ